MANYALRFNGVNNYLTIPPWTVDGDWEIEIEYVIHDYSSPNMLLASGIISFFIASEGGNGFNLRTDGNNIVNHNLGLPVNSTVLLKYSRIGGVFAASVNGTVIDTSTVSPLTSPATIDRFGVRRESDYPLSGDIIQAKLTRFDVPSLSRVYELNEGTGTTILDSSGNSAHGTFINPPASDAQWILLPGGSISLAANDISSTSVIDQVGLTLHTSLSVNDLLSPTTLDQPVVTQRINLPVNDLNTDTSIDAVSILLNSSLAVNALLSSASIDQVEISRTTAISVNSSVAGTKVDSVDVTLAGNSLTVNDIQSAAEIESVSLIKHTLISVNGLTLVSTIDSTSPSTAKILAVNDLSVSTKTAQVALTRKVVLSINESFAQALIDDAEITRYATININDLLLTTQLDAVNVIDKAFMDVDYQLLKLISQTPVYILN